MKKLFSLSLIMMSIAILLSGCGGPSQALGNGEKIYTVGIGQFGDHASLDNCREGFKQGLAEEGFIQGENLKIIEGNAQFDISIASQIFQSFKSKKIDLMAAIATPMAQSAYNVARDTDIPVVFTAVTDPEIAEITQGNITGTSDKLPVESQLKLIRAMLPEAKNIGILFTTSEVNSVSVVQEYKDLSGKYGFNIVAMGINTSTDIPLKMDKILPEVDAMTNLLDNTVVASLPLVLSKANEKKIPVFGSEIEQVKLGSVAAEGLDYIELGKQTGRMAGKILKGEITADQLDYEIIKESSLYINSKVMKELGLELPQSFIERAIDVNKM